MKYTLFTIVLFFASLTTTTMQAQTARDILDRVSVAYKKAGGITAVFSLDSEDTKNKTTYSQDGKASLQGDKFKIDVPDGITWFDGTDQWVYVKDTEEVNITTPTKEELRGISPIAIFNMYQTGFDLKYIGEKSLNGKSVLEIEMTPSKIVKQKSDISKITMQIDKATNIFSKIAVTNKSGFVNTISIRNLKTGIQFGANEFKFAKAQYPKVEIVDLR